MIVVLIPEERQQKRMKTLRSPYSRWQVKDKDKNLVVLTTSNNHTVTFDRQTLADGLEELLTLLDEDKD